MWTNSTVLGPASSAMAMRCSDIRPVTRWTYERRPGFSPPLPEKSESAHGVERGVADRAHLRCFEVPGCGLPVGDPYNGFGAVLLG